MDLIKLSISLLLWASFYTISSMDRPDSKGPSAQIESLERQVQNNGASLVTTLMSKGTVTVAVALCVVACAAAKFMHAAAQDRDNGDH